MNQEQYRKSVERRELISKKMYWQGQRKKAEKLIEKYQKQIEELTKEIEA